MTGAFHQIQCWGDPVYWDEDDTCHWRNIAKTLSDLSQRPWGGKEHCEIMFKINYVVETASPPIRRTWGASSFTELEFVIGMRRSRAAFQPCWLYDTTPLKQDTVPGSILSFPIEIQGHQSLCWARGLNSFLSRTSSWNKRSMIQKGEKILKHIFQKCTNQATVVVFVISYYALMTCLYEYDSNQYVVSHSSSTRILYIQ